MGGYSEPEPRDKRIRPRDATIAGFFVAPACVGTGLAFFLCLWHEKAKLKFQGVLMARREPGADPVIGKLVQRIAEDNSFNLRTDSDCADDLIASVAVACAHVRTMVDELGEPFALELNPRTENALGPVLFDSRQDALAALRQASKIKEVFTSSAARECVFILTKQRHEYHVFGREIEGDVI